VSAEGIVHLADSPQSRDGRTRSRGRVACFDWAVASREYPPPLERPCAR